MWIQLKWIRVFRNGRNIRVVFLEESDLRDLRKGNYKNDVNNFNLTQPNLVIALAIKVDRAYQPPIIAQRFIKNLKNVCGYL